MCVPEGEALRVQMSFGQTSQQPIVRSAVFERLLKIGSTLMMKPSPANDLPFLAALARLEFEEQLSDFH
jgi:hypothetical protein